MSVTVQGYRCPFDPGIYAGKPIGMFHCPFCGCIVLAAENGYGDCLPGFCPAIDEGDHPGAPIAVELSDQDARYLLGIES